MNDARMCATIGILSASTTSPPTVPGVTQESTTPSSRSTYERLVQDPAQGRAFTREGFKLKSSRATSADRPPRAVSTGAGGQSALVARQGFFPCPFLVPSSKLNHTVSSVFFQCPDVLRPPAGSWRPFPYLLRGGQGVYIPLLVASFNRAEGGLSTLPRRAEQGRLSSRMREKNKEQCDAETGVARYDERTRNNFPRHSGALTGRRTYPPNFMSREKKRKEAAQRAAGAGNGLFLPIHFTRSEARRLGQCSSTARTRNRQIADARGGSANCTVRTAAQREQEKVSHLLIAHPSQRCDGVGVRMETGGGERLRDEDGTRKSVQDLVAVNLISCEPRTSRRRRLGPLLLSSGLANGNFTVAASACTLGNLPMGKRSTFLLLLKATWLRPDNLRIHYHTSQERPKFESRMDLAKPFQATHSYSGTNCLSTAWPPRQVSIDIFSYREKKRSRAREREDALLLPSRVQRWRPPPAVPFNQANIGLTTPNTVAVVVVHYTSVTRMPLL
ncbi:hypothetical protein BIW11_02816 [Tropilaelaps mercedesae]|uniref:Uncharacterized protein n=1 Tax=Tropilaelaps mercedesae TaxID=418985 RepID=A0A1V9XX17_9ACAR|nr:hypothetical protein BIW11_02816 [Tropilaelaps mercedesae]